MIVCRKRSTLKTAVSGSLAWNSGFFRGPKLPTIFILLIVFCFVSPPKILASGPIPFTENFDSFTGSGFNPAPNPGQLDSDIWIVNGLSDGTMNFGDAREADDFARGTSSGNATTGGVYAFDAGGGDIILGVQPTGADFAPGEITLQLQNNSGSLLTELAVEYDIRYLNNEDRANALNFSFSPDNVTYTTMPSLDFTTPEAADGLPWQTAHRATALTGLNINNGDFFYLKWTGDDISGGGSRDEYGLDNIQIGDAPPSVTGTTPNSDDTDVAAETNIQIMFNEAVNVIEPWFDITCANSGSHSATVSGGPQQYTLNPDTRFANNESCTVSMWGAQITDATGNPMAADYTFDFTTTSGWIINEIHADPDSTAGDANGDGMVDTGDDEFVELINNTGSPVDISGWTLADNTGPRHTFPPNTIIPDQCAIVVFGGGTPTGTFGDAIVQTAGTLGLNNGGDALTLNDGTTNRAAHTYGSEGGDNQSLTRDPDLTGSTFVRHSTAAGSGGLLFSPGTHVDGTPFGSCLPPDNPPTVTATNPVDTAIDVPVNTSITLQFSEMVSVSAAALAIECPAGAPVPFNMTPTITATAFALTPAANLPYQTTCTVVIPATGVVDQDGSPDPLNANHSFTFTTIAPPPSPDPLLISEFVYDGTASSTEGDEYIEICNPNSAPLDLAGYKIGDEETNGGGEGMYSLPGGIILAPDDCLVIAKSGSDFFARFDEWPDYEIIESDPAIPTLNKYTTWSSGSWALSNNGDELIVLGPNDEILDSVAYRNGDYEILNLEPDASAPEPHSLQRIWPVDTNSMPYDFVRAGPNPGVPTIPPSPAPVAAPPPADLPDGMHAYWGDLHAHTSYSDGAGPPYYALALARAAGHHFFAITDHGHSLSLHEWNQTLTQTNQATEAGQFVALRGVEWTHRTEGHINIFNNAALLSREDPQFDTLTKMYDWLATQPDTIAQLNHPGINYDGDFESFPFNSQAFPIITLQEIGNNARDYLTYESAFIQSNMMGWAVAPTNNSDIHTAHWGSDSATRTGIVAPALTQPDLLDAMRARRVFATEDSNLALALRLNNHWMGSVITTTGRITLTIDVTDADSEAVTVWLYDGNLPLATVPFDTNPGQWSTTVTARPGHFFWVKAIQADGDTAYSAPIWITGEASPDPITINEILPAPYDWDWDGNGMPDHTDEWVELYNLLDQPVGLGGWRLTDNSNLSYTIPLDTIIPARGFITFYQAQTGFSLNNDGDTVSLIHPNGTVVDTFTYTHSPGYDETWCRLPDGQTSWSEDCGPSPNRKNWKKEASGPLKVSIFEAKQLTLDAWVRVEGQVTAPPGLLGSRTMYIQDETSGILIYLPKDHKICNLGDTVEVEGYLKNYHEELEIKVNERSDVKCVESGSPPPPLPVATTSILEPYEGMLVMIQGQAVDFKGRATMWVDDGTDPAKVYIRQRTGIRKPFIERGTTVTVVGIVSQYSEDGITSRDEYRMLPRYQNDLIVPETPVPANWPTLLPETGF